MSALVFTLVANPKTVKAKGYEINGGIAGVTTHLERIIRVNTRTIAWVRRHRREYRSLEGVRSARSVAVRARVRASKRLGRLFPYGYWDRIVPCETGSWARVGSSFSGGLGFANSTWTAYRPRWFPSNAGYASREEQIVVAERIGFRKYDPGVRCENWRGW